MLLPAILVILNLIQKIIMDINDHESTFQYFKITNNIVDDDDDVNNISNEESNLIGIDDILNLPVNDNDVDDNGTINDNSNSNNNDDEEDKDNKQIFYVTFNGKTEPELNDNDIKLITLNDGRMFMTAGDNLHSSIVIKDEAINETNEFSNDNINKNNNNDIINYQIIQLSDGTQALIKLYKINETAKVKEENAPKKIKKHHCTFEGCTKVYATSYHLTVHMRTHTDSRPYGCTVDGCGKRFSTNYSLKAHIRTHTGEKPYGCTICIKQFKTSGDLQKHTRTHTGEKPFMCPIEGCGKSFTTSNIRKVHIRSHTGERPYSCDYPSCGKAFTSSTNYKNHLRIHSGEKPYVCPIEGCHKRFTEYSSLYKHNAVHQTVKSFGCVLCGQCFKQESALNYHKRIKHNVVLTQDGKEIIVQMVQV